MLKDLITANRSVRGYDHDVKPSLEDLLYMVDCARLSASSMNKQFLKYYIAVSDSDVGFLNHNTKLGGLLPDLGLPFRGTEPPAFICICYDTDITPYREGNIKDVGIAAQSITLAATELGYNACMIGNYNPTKIKEGLNLPMNLDVMLVIAIGKSIEEIVIDEIREDESTAYYRQDGVHHVPKRRLDDIIINR